MTSLPDSGRCAPAVFERDPRRRTVTSLPASGRCALLVWKEAVKAHQIYFSHMCHDAVRTASPLISDCHALRFASPWSPQHARAGDDNERVRQVAEDAVTWFAYCIMVQYQALSVRSIEWVRWWGCMTVGSCLSVRRSEGARSSCLASVGIGVVRCGRLRGGRRGLGCGPTCVCW